MKIDELINILEKAKSEGLVYCKILNISDDDDIIFDNNISGYSYCFKQDSIFLFPDYL